MNKHNCRKIALPILMVVLLIFHMNGAVGETGIVRYRTVQEIVWPLAYSDNCFSGSGEIYHHELAKSSLGMALSAFRKLDVSLSEKGDNIHAFLTELGYYNILLEQYDITPTIDTIATAIAMKETNISGEPYTLLAVAISGGAYLDEWESNFLVGTGIHHEGFLSAANQVYQRIAAYLSLHHIDGKKKIWIAGYSRAAATANMTAAMILDNKLATAGDLYAYTFATPNVTRDPKAAEYPSIFNIIGAFDPVPSIPFEAWGFGHFGKTYYLPSIETNSDYEQRVVPVKEAFAEITGSEYWANPSDNLLLQKLFSLLAVMITDVQDYASHYQPLLIHAWKDKHSAMKMLADFGTAIIRDGHLRRELEDELEDVWAVLSNMGQEMMVQSIQSRAGYWNANVGLLENVMHEHYPKGYLAWFSAYDSLEGMVTQNRNFRRISVPGNAGFQVFDTASQLLMKYNMADEAFADSNANAIFPLEKSGDEIILTLPADREYHMDVYPRGADVRSFIIREGVIGKTKMSEYSAATADTQTQAVYSFLFPTEFGGEGAVYQLVSEQGSIPFRFVQESAPMDPLELDSGTRHTFTQRAVSYLLVIGLILIQFAWLIVILIRSLRHRKLMTELKGSPSKGNNKALFLNKKSKTIYFAMKATASLLAMNSLWMIIEWGAMGLVLLRLNRQQWLAMEWFMLFSQFPVLLFVLFTSAPSFLSAFHMMVYSIEDAHKLKTARLFIYAALPGAVALMAFTLDFFVAAQSMMLAVNWVLSSLYLMNRKKQGVVRQTSKACNK